MNEIWGLRSLIFIISLDTVLGCKRPGTGDCCHNYIKIKDQCIACPPGRWGPKCSKRCPDGYYGINCVQLCNCSVNEICNIEYGCESIVLGITNAVLALHETKSSNVTGAITIPSPVITLEDNSNNVIITYIIMNGSWIAALVISVTLISMYIRYRSIRRAEERNDYMPAASASIPTIRDVYCTVNDHLYSEIDEVHTV